jgi:hypothetical protein
MWRWTIFYFIAHSARLTCFTAYSYVYVRACVRACVCVWEREREYYIQYNLDYSWKCGPRLPRIIRKGRYAFINYCYKLFILNFHKKSLTVFCLIAVPRFFVAVSRRRPSNKRSSGVVPSCCPTHLRAVSIAFRPSACDFFFYNFCANFILLFFTFFFLFAHKIYDHIVSHFLLFVIIHPLLICLPVLTTGLGAAAPEIIYALSSVQLG